MEDFCVLLDNIGCELGMEKDKVNMIASRYMSHTLSLVEDCALSAGAENRKFITNKDVNLAMRLRKLKVN